MFIDEKVIYIMRSCQIVVLVLFYVTSTPRTRVVHYKYNTRLTPCSSQANLKARAKISVKMMDQHQTNIGSAYCVCWNISEWFLKSLGACKIT